MRRQNQIEDNTEVEFRIVEVKVKGGSPSVIESLRTMASAFSAKPKLVQPKLIPQALPKEDEDSLQESLDFGDAAPEPVVAEGSSKTPRARSPRKPSTAPDLVTGLDHNNGKPSFADFFKQIGEPEDHRHRYLAIAYWLKRHYASPITAITPAHPFTVYRLMNWAVPKDAAVPLLDATSKRQWFTKEDKGYVISNVGESAIDKLLAKKK